MASGLQHDRATWALSLPFALLWWPWLGWSGLAGAWGGFLVGGLLLSPDLDTLSKPTRRWGPLRLLWWPYRRLLRHRSLLSHSPLLGTLGRLAHLAGLGLLAAAALQPLGAPSPGALIDAARSLWNQQPTLLISIAAGLEASSWLHLIQDGDPIPRLPRALGWLRRTLWRRQGRSRLRQRGSRLRQRRSRRH